MTDCCEEADMPRRFSSEPLQEYDFGPAPKRRVEVWRDDTLVFAYGPPRAGDASETPEAAGSDIGDEYADQQQG
jgi:hypothetical protein